MTAPYPADEWDFSGFHVEAAEYEELQRKGRVYLMKVVHASVGSHVYIQTSRKPKIHAIIQELRESKRGGGLQTMLVTVARERMNDDD